jgi:predicted AlkP superfamily phosphohydrolase/phosphomutase/tetratricopeptide (TPR) repeat protein
VFIPKPRSTNRILLVGWDGADWKIASPLMDRGELPQLAEVVEHGASGPLASLPPYLSPMLWNSIATGKYADQHGILGFTTTDPATGKLAPITSTQRQCKAIWNILSEQDLRTHVVGWFASHPAENVNGIYVTESFPRPVARGADWPLATGSIHPKALTEEFAELRLRPEDVDEKIIRLFVPRAHEIDTTKDRRLDTLAVRLAELYSVHNAAIAALDDGDTNFLGVYYHFIDWICHDFMEFHPPRRPHVSEKEFELYKDVVNSAYRLSDLLLADLLRHAGPDTTVILCSDHGFHSDNRRPVRIPMVSAGIAIWHRHQGLFAAAGPGIARDQLVTGATLLDITPTILHLFGLPVGADMDGRVITSALATPSDAQTIPTWENEPGIAPRPRHLDALNHSDKNALLEQFAALGYVDLNNTGPDAPSARTHRDNRWNLAITLRHAGRHEAALELLTQLHLELPEDPRYAYHLARCQQYLGLHREALATEETIRDFTPGNAQAELILAELASAREDPTAALVHLDAVNHLGSLASEASQPTVQDSVRLVQQGRLKARLGKTLEAAADFQSAIEIDSENATAWLAYAQALLSLGHAADAETCARETVALEPTMAMAHFTLAQTLAHQKKPEAEAHFQRALQLNPRLASVRAPLNQSSPSHTFSVDASVNVSALTDASSDEARALNRVFERFAAHQAQLDASRAGQTPVEVYQPPTTVATETVASDAPTFVIVSGLPRSGTSLMMQMLARGGLEPMTDGQRTADESNPEGYLEWEEIKQLPQRPDLLRAAEGKAIKVVSPLIPHLPGRFRYKIIFMTRPAAEIARSQEKMRATAQPEAPAPSATAMQPLLEQHAHEILTQLLKWPSAEVLEVSYPSLVANPADEVSRVVNFLGSARLPNAERMHLAVRPELHRQKSSQS